MDLKIFKNESFEIRTFNLDGQSYFLANDICKALGYKNPSDAIIRHCDGGVVKYDTPTSWRTSNELYR